MSKVSDKKKVFLMVSDFESQSSCILYGCKTKRAYYNSRCYAMSSSCSLHEVNGRNEIRRDDTAVFIRNLSIRNLRLKLG